MEYFVNYIFTALKIFIQQEIERSNAFTLVKFTQVIRQGCCRPKKRNHLFV